MSEEEKEPIEELEDFIIEKQQKEIEELKEKNKTLETLLQGTLYEMYLYYKELASRYQANSISKDKIREKIKELVNRNVELLGVDRYYFAIEILQELIEE